MMKSGEVIITTAKGNKIKACIITTEAVEHRYQVYIRM